MTAVTRDYLQQWAFDPDIASLPYRPVCPQGEVPFPCHYYFHVMRQTNRSGLPALFTLNGVPF